MRLNYLVLIVAVLTLFGGAYARQSEWTLKGRARGVHEVEHKVAFVVKMNHGAKQQGELIAKEGQVMSFEGVQEFFVNNTAVKIVEDFLRSKSLSFTTQGVFVWVTATTSVLDDLLDAEFHLYSHNIKDKQAPKTEHYTIPDEVSEEVSAIICTRDLPAVRTARSKNKVARDTQTYHQTPDIVHALYGVPKTRLNSPHISQGILGADGGFFKSDLTLFFTTYNSTASADDAYVYNTSFYDPSHCATDDCGEQAIDMEWIMTMAPGIKTWFFYSTGDVIAESTNWLATGANAPLSFSTSIGWYDLSDEYMISICDQILIAALRGVTYFSASGDGGWDDPTDYPTVCPYVTAVGGTYRDSTQSLPETTWSGSGTISAPTWSQPSWQIPFANYYFKQVGSQADFPSFNRTARLYADVAAIASDTLPFAYNGALSDNGGTSFASPIFAGVLSQVNAYRNASGHPTVGYLNNALGVLYKAGYSPLNDISTGYSSADSLCSGCIIPAIQGWDMATGFGAPNYTKMIQYLGSFNGTAPSPAPQTTNITLTINAGAGPYYLQILIANDYALTTNLEVLSSGSTDWVSGTSSPSEQGLWSFYPAPSFFTLDLSVRLTSDSTLQQITLGNIITSWTQQTLNTGANYRGTHYYWS